MFIFLLLCLNVAEKSIIGFVMAGSIVTNHSIWNTKSVQLSFFLGSSLLNTYCSNFWKIYNHSNIHVYDFLSVTTPSEDCTMTVNTTCSPIMQYVLRARDGFKK